MGCLLVSRAIEEPDVSVSIGVISAWHLKNGRLGNDHDGGGRLDLDLGNVSEDPNRAGHADRLASVELLGRARELSAVASPDDDAEATGIGKGISHIQER